MTVKARFWVTGKNHHQNSPTSADLSADDQQACTVTFAPVYGEANETWSKYTPSGSIEMLITNRAAHEQFELGKAYELTFEPVDQADSSE